MENKYLDAVQSVLNEAKEYEEEENQFVISNKEVLDTMKAMIVLLKKIEKAIA